MILYNQYTRYKGANTAMIYNNILEAVGNTPIIELQKLVNDDSASILVKFEGLNVG